MPRKTLPPGVDAETLRDVCRATAEFALHKNAASAAMSESQLLHHFYMLFEAAIVCFAERSPKVPLCPEPSPN